MGKVDRDHEDASPSEALEGSIPGNAPDEVKVLVRRWLAAIAGRGFGTRSVRDLELVEVSIRPNPEEPRRREARVVLEMTVNEDMLNSAGKTHGACIVHLVDICTTLPITAMAFADGKEGSAGVTQNINVAYHVPTSLGDKLRLINTSTMVGSRTWSARIEIWDTTHGRLVASATQVKMEASPSKL